VAELLSGWGSQVAECSDGVDALTELELAEMAGKPFDLVLLDSQLQKSDGFIVANRIMKETECLPVICMMLNCKDLRGERARAGAMGLKWHLVKPVSRSALNEVLLDALEKTSLTKVSQDGGPAMNHAHDMALTHPLAILLVEDNPSNRKVIELYLKQLPCRITVAENGKDAVEKFTAGNFDLVLMDMEMPIMDGYDATLIIRDLEANPPVPPTPIVALTAHSFKEDKEKCLSVGCTDYLSKPLKKEDLWRIIRTVASEKQWGRLDRASLPYDGSIHDEMADSRFAPHSPEKDCAIIANIDADLEELIPLYMENTWKDVQEMFQALEKEDFRILQRLGHSAKGAAGSYGFEPLSRISEAMEKAAKINDSLEVKKQLQAFVDYLGRVKVVYE